MDIIAVKAKVDTHIDASDVLTLPSQNNGLNSAGIDALIDVYFSSKLSGTIHRTQNGDTATVDEAKQEATYKLTLPKESVAFFNASSPVSADLIFNSKDPDIKCRINLVLPQGYNPAECVREIAGQPTLPINQIRLQNSTITVQSGTKPTCHYEGSLQPVGPLKTVDWLLPKAMSLNGSIDVVAGSQRFVAINLAASDVLEFPFGVFTLSLSVRTQVAARLFPNHKPDHLYESRVELVTAFKTPALTIPVVLPLYGDKQYLLSFYLDLAKRPPIKDFNALSGFTGGGDPKQLLNADLNIGDAKLSLDSLSVVVDPYAKKLVSIETGVSLELNWSIIPNTLELNKIGTVFTLEDPARPKLENASARLFADLKVGPAFLEASIDLPDKTLLAHLAPGTAIKVNDLIGTFAQGLKLPGNDEISIDQLEVMARLKKGEQSYSLEAGASGQLTIINGLAITDVRLFVAYGAQAISDVSLCTKLLLTNINVELALRAVYQKETGWQFEGSTGPGQDIPVGNLIKDLSNLFGNFNLPDALANLVIRNLKASFNTKSKDFSFEAEAQFGNDAKIAITFSNIHQEGTTPAVYEKRATGVITIYPGDKDKEFALALGIDIKPDSKHFVALYNNTSGKSIKLGDLIKALAPNFGSLTDIPNFEVNIKDAIAGFASNEKGTQCIFAIDIGATLDLSSLGNIPLVGQALSAAKTLNLAFQLAYPAVAKGETFANADLLALNNLITVPGPKLPTNPNGLKDLSIKTELRLGDGAPIDFGVPVTINKTTGELTDDSGNTPFNPPGNEPTDDDVKWFQLDKKFGPVQLQRAGFKYKDGNISVLLDGGLSALGLEVDLMGFSVTSALTGFKKNGKFEPEFGLQGLGLSFTKGGVEIAGALLHLQVKRDEKTVDEYDGLASIQAQGLRLAAIGSLTQTDDGQTALFLYAVLNYPLGGAPFFYVTGLAAGFGLNQKLIMPAVDQVSTFPLVVAAKEPPKIPTDPGSAGKFITEQMNKLRGSLQPTVGQYFGCAGIRFTSFELVDSFILISLSFGKEFELNLLGLSTLVVPPKEPKSVPSLAVVSLQIAASFIPSQGLFIAQGRLTKDSHILDPNCHLTGGFAIATWFGPSAHAGDFVITLGGYHPEFQKPDHYPSAPRIGLNWQVSDYLSVTGGLYFALTPRAMMAGGAMRAVFQMSLDIGIATVDIKAWFILGADFIVYWKPFHYKAHIYIDIGIDVVIHFLGTHDIGFDAGADLEVWGSPFGGHARVSLKVIGITFGFNIDFGAAAPEPPLLVWDDEKDQSKSFRQSFLPDDTKIVSAAVSAGLDRKIDLDYKPPVDGGGSRAARVEASAQNDDKTDVWYVINPKDFRLSTSSVVPIKDVTSSIKQEGDPGNTNFGIAPMGKDASKVKTFHEIKVTHNNNPADANFVLRPIHGDVPGGLWADKNSDNINDQRLIENVVTGYEVLPAKSPISGHTKPIKRDLLEYTTHAMDNAYADNAIHGFTTTIKPPGDDPAGNEKIWRRVQEEIRVNPTRAAMLAAMGFADTDFNIGEPFTDDAAYAPNYGLLNR